MASDTDVTVSHHELTSVISDDVYLEESELIAELSKKADSSMSQDDMLESTAPTPLRQSQPRKSSFFEVPNIHTIREQSHHGKSITSFARDPMAQRGSVPAGKTGSSHTGSLDQEKDEGTVLGQEKEGTVISITSSTHSSSSRSVPASQISLENTYNTSPLQKFRSEPVQKIIQEVLDEHLGDKKYDSISCALSCKLLSQEIKTRVKKLNFERYKILVVVTIGEKNDQGVYYGSRCIWNTDYDTSASATFENNTLFGVACVYALYFE